MIRDRVLACLRKAVPGVPEKIEPETVLLTSGLIDSLSLVDLITTIEGEFGIRFSSDEMIPENFDSLRAMGELVGRKVEGGR